MKELPPAPVFPTGSCLPLPTQQFQDPVGLKPLDGRSVHDGDGNAEESHLLHLVQVFRVGRAIPHFVGNPIILQKAFQHVALQAMGLGIENHAHPQHLLEKIYHIPPVLRAPSTCRTAGGKTVIMEGE